MKLTDIIELAKQGYTPADIKELINIQEVQEVQTTEQETQPTADLQEQKVAESEQQNLPEQSADMLIDYKKLYEESQKKLEVAQKSNIKQNIQPENTATDEDILAEFVKGFM